MQSQDAPVGAASKPGPRVAAAPGRGAGRGSPGARPESRGLRAGFVDDSHHPEWCWEANSEEVPTETVREREWPLIVEPVAP